MNTSRIKNMLTQLFGIFMILGGIIHFITPEMFFPFFPEAFPITMIIYVSGVLEVAIGVGVFIKRWSIYSIKAIFILMVLFLPLHVVDVFKENPAIGSKLLAYIRLPLQFVLIYWAYFIQEKKRATYNR
jgi:uncharacterized membrane protein